jgi:hypothetical protein
MTRLFLSAAQLPTRSRTSVRTFYTLIASVAAILSCRPALAQGAISASQEDAQSQYVWFDKLGYSGVVSGAFVALDTRYRDVSGHRLEMPRRFGFLVRGGKSTFAILTTDLELFYHPHVSDFAPDEASYTPVNFHTWIAAELARASADGSQYSYPPDETTNELSRRAQFFVLSRACAARGEFRAAQGFLRLATAGHGPSVTNRPVRDLLAEDFAYAEVSRAALELRDLAMPREKLLERFRNVVIRFPDSNSAIRAREPSAILEQMAREDREHEVRQRADSSSPPKGQRVTELIFELRNQVGQQSDRNGVCDPFADLREDKSPAAELVRIGMAAVPQLLDAVTNAEFTRSVQPWQNGVFSHKILRVGQVALAVLERIANRSFDSTTFSPGDKAAVALMQSRVRDWWSHVDRSEELTKLVNAVEQGDREAATKASQLVDLYPHEATAAIRAGVQRATDSYARGELISTLKGLNTAEALTFAAVQMEHGADLRARLNAAQVVFGTHPGRAVQALVVEYKRGIGTQSSEFDSDELIQLLADSERAIAVDALGFGLRSRSVDTRLRIVEGIASNVAYKAQYVKSSAETRAGQRAYWTAVERLFGNELTDTDRREGSLIGIVGADFVDPRVCDIALYGLSRLSPERYTYSKSASPRTRERVRITSLNVWRKANGLAPIPLPARPQPVRLADNLVQPLSSRLASSRTPRQRQAAEHSIYGLGLPALPAVVQSLKYVSKTSSAHGELSELASRLGSIVSHVTITPGAGPQELVRAAKRLRGKRLTAEGVGRLLSIAVRVLPTSKQNLLLLAIRDDDLTGFELEIDFSRSSHVADQEGWSTVENVLVNGIPVYNSSGSSADSYMNTPEAYRELLHGIQVALGKPLTDVIQVKVRLTYY